MPELEDYSCPFKPDLTFEDFSKDFLLKLMTGWQFAWLRMADAWYEIRSPNHVIMTILQCRSLISFEREAPHMIEPTCYRLEERVMRAYLVNPRIKVTPLKLPPRRSRDEAACIWEFTMQDAD